nr:hypothetical protein BaRGS_013927 [Batillaria attramentaria]
MDSQPMVNRSMVSNRSMVNHNAGSHSMVSNRSMVNRHRGLLVSNRSMVNRHRGLLGSMAVDQDHSGKITAQELQQALMNGNWSPFNPETCRLMIGMFDKDRFDTDRSGNIDANELSNAFQTFGTFTDKFRAKDTQQQGVINISYEEFLEMALDTTLNTI